MPVRKCESTNIHRGYGYLAMVVVSGNWVKSVAVYPTSTNNSDVELSQVTMIPKAVLSCRPNSHLFQERTLALDQSVKIGRSVARAKPTSTNAIFDCKVLSRHHALLWYENGKFFLQDTKSSNGTFVNNNRLSAETENHELSSGDIVQFGVDVVENNRKVTHGCIIATIKLYMPDGKEAKASPVTEGDRHGMVPLDDLYKLNQIIQEANQREKCLETKLTALQHVVNETRKSAEESWQAYVGEERLLSRVSALETQLQQANKSWGEDRLREELAKLQESNESYQIAAKEALEKLHAERLQAMALAMEQERAKISAEQEAVLAKEQFYQAQVEVEAMARQLTEHQIEAENIQFELKQREKELESKLESESGKLLDLQLKLFEMNTLSDQDFPNREGLEGMHKDLIYDDDLRCKEELIAENDDCVSLMNMSNGVDNHISLTFGPVEDKIESEKGAGETTEVEECDCEVNQQKLCQEDIKRVSFKIAEDCESEEDFHDSNDRSDSTKEDMEKNYYASDRVDSKTLKYQFQSAQNELKRKIELLETISNENKLKINDLDKELLEEKKISQLRLEENEGIKEELVLLQQKWKESCNETLEYKDKMCVLLEELELAKKQLKDLNENVKEKIEETQWGPTISNSVVSYDQLVELEEELVLLKERFSQVSEEKIKLQRDFSMLTKQYNVVCNRSHNKYFFYVAPLVIMVLYLLVSAMIS
nr:sarcolemmal membrane-associated protein isoform X1 [Leptinotarsa decemlineata]